MIYLFQGVDFSASQVFDPRGIPDEILKTAVVVDSLPTSEVIAGKISILKCNSETKEVWYDYIDAPVIEDEDQLPIDETLEAKVVRLEQEVKNLQEVIDTMLGV